MPDRNIARRGRCALQNMPAAVRRYHHSEQRVSVRGLILCAAHAMLLSLGSALAAAREPFRPLSASGIRSVPMAGAFLARAKTFYLTYPRILLVWLK